MVLVTFFPVTSKVRHLRFCAHYVICRNMFTVGFQQLGFQLGDVNI